MSDEFSVHGRFLLGKIDEAEYLRKMAYMREREERFEEEMRATNEVDLLLAESSAAEPGGHEPD